MPNREFIVLIDKFKGINELEDSNNLELGEMQTQSNLVVQGSKITLAKKLGTTNLPQDSTARWMKIWSDSQDTWYILLALDDSTNTDLKYYSGATWGSSATFTDLFSADKVSTPSAYTVGGELRIGGSLTNYHKFIKYFPLTYRLGNATGAAETHAYIAAGLKMYKGEIEYPNENSEITAFTATSQDSGYDFLATDSVEYGLTYTYDNAQESLMYTGTTDTSINAGQRVALALQITPGASNNLSWRVTHVNIYRSLNSGDYYLLSTIQVNSPVATADYGETKTGIDWTWDNGNDRGDITVYDTGAVLVDTYTSRTGYSDFVAHDGTTEYLDDSLRVFFKVSTVCQGRAVIGNARRYVGTDLETYNDRLYFSAAGKFDSFYKDDWIDLETGDGDEITALVNLGGRLVVFKENNMYIWNMGTRSELNWFREASLRGYGVAGQKNAISTPYGIAFNNANGIYLYNGTGEPEEISKKIRPSMSSATAIGYDPINRRVLGFQSATRFWLIDIDDGFIGVQSGTASVVSFDIYENEPYILDSTTDQVYNINQDTTGVILSLLTGDMSFNTERNKRIKRIRIKYHWAAASGSPAITITLSNDYGTTTITSDLPETTGYSMHEFYPNMYGRQFRLSFTVAPVGIDVFKLASIEITGKIYRT
jgi:hypothetical protein